MIDLLIAGGGPAGLATAIYAAQAGMEAVVIEPRSSPIDKACGEGVMPGGVAELRTMGVTVDGHLLRGIRYLDRHSTVDATFRNGFGLGIRRPALHTALTQRATELGITVLNSKVDSVQQYADKVEACGLRAQWLVAADGLHSPLRRRYGLDIPDNRPARYGLRQHYHIPVWTDFVEVHWAAKSEAYVTPVSKDLVGVAILTAQRGNYQSQLEQFPKLAARLPKSAVTNVLGAGPLRQKVRHRIAGRIFLVGDAAGYTDALTGEGVALALRSARALVNCLRAGRPELYEQAWRSLSRQHRLLTEGLLHARRYPFTARWIVPAARRLPRVFRAIVHALQ